MFHYNNINICQLVLQREVSVYWVAIATITVTPLKAAASCVTSAWATHIDGN